MVPAFNERYKDDGIIWFLESCDLNVMSMRRALWNLDEAGWFEHVKGFLIGRPFLYEEEMLGMDRINAVTGVLERYDVPVVVDVDLGHLPPTMPLISGAMADIAVSANKLSVKMRLE